MSFARLTRPDDSPIAINPDEIVHVSPVPASGPLMEPLTKGTRIVFRDQPHQDVREPLDEVVSQIDAARSDCDHAGAASTATPRRVTRKSRR